MKDITGWENVMKNLAKKKMPSKVIRHALLYDKNFIEAKEALDKLQKIK